MFRANSIAPVAVAIGQGLLFGLITLVVAYGSGVCDSGDCSDTIPDAGLHLLYWALALTGVAALTMIVRAGAIGTGNNSVDGVALVIGIVLLACAWMPLVIGLGKHEAAPSADELPTPTARIDPQSPEGIVINDLQRTEHAEYEYARAHGPGQYTDSLAELQTYSPGLTQMPSKLSITVNGLCCSLAQDGRRDYYHLSAKVPGRPTTFQETEKYPGDYVVHSCQPRGAYGCSQAGTW